MKIIPCNKQNKYMIPPAKSIIPRTVDKEVMILLDDFSKKIEETVNLGSNILLEDIQKGKNKGGFENLPIIFFLRNYLEQLDACSILIRYATSEPVKNLLRTALENFFYIEYLLEKDFEQRSLSFLICTAYKTKSVYEKADGKSSLYLELAEIYKQDKILSEARPIIMPNIESLKESNIELLNQFKYKETSQEYQKRLGKRKRLEWYSLYDGPKNIKELADHLKYPAFYNILYQDLSSSTHGTNIFQGKINTDLYNHPTVYQIRLPLDIEFLVSLCIILSFHLLMITLIKDYQVKKMK